MFRYRTLPILAALLLIVACSDDNGDGGGAAGDDNGVAVQLLNTGSGTLDVEESLGEGIRFCYAGEGCEDHNATGGTYVVDEGESQIIAQSDPTREAVGAEVGLDVHLGSGEANVLSGRSYEVDGVEQFDIASTIETSDPFNEGDVVNFSAGDTNPASNNNGGGGGDDNGYALRFINTVPDAEPGDLFDFYWYSDPENQWVRFCYDDGECSAASAGGASAAGGRTLTSTISDPDRHAVGMDVNIVVREGQGEVEIVHGRSYGESGSEEFDVSGVSESSGPFEEGDTVTMTVGEIHE